MRNRQIGARACSPTHSNSHILRAPLADDRVRVFAPIRVRARTKKLARAAGGLIYYSTTPKRAGSRVGRPAALRARGEPSARLWRPSTSDCRGRRVFPAISDPRNIAKIASFLPLLATDEATAFGGVFMLKTPRDVKD